MVTFRKTFKIVASAAPQNTEKHEAEERSVDPVKAVENGEEKEGHHGVQELH
jgi:hypothetical protein